MTLEKERQELEAKLMAIEEKEWATIAPHFKAVAEYIATHLTKSSSKLDKDGKPYPDSVDSEALGELLTKSQESVNIENRFRFGLVISHK